MGTSKRCPPEYLELQLHREHVLAPYDPDDERFTARQANAVIACLAGEAKALEIKQKLAQPGAVTTIPGV